MRGYNKKMILSFAVFITIFILARSVVVPASFGDYGWYRGDSVGDFASIEPVYSTSDKCEGCHSEYTDWAAGEHKTVSCETCKGPGSEHILNPAANEMDVDTSRDFCALCHNQNPSRPVEFSQKNVSVHNRGQLCIECHNPHDPYLVWRDFYKRTAYASASQLFEENCYKCHENASEFEAFKAGANEEEWRAQVEKMSRDMGLDLSNAEKMAIATYILENIAAEE